MEFWSTISGKVIDITSSVIVATLMHIPFLMNTLMSVPSTPVSVKLPPATHSQVSTSTPHQVQPIVKKVQTQYIPKPIILSESEILNGRLTEDKSPNGEYISHTYDNEQGDAGVYLTNRNGDKITATYCGYFREWSPDSKKIKVFVPDVCAYSVPEEETFELHIDGTITK